MRLPDSHLLFTLNLLQENVGACDVLRSNAPVAELLASLELNWEFFPPGTALEVERFFRSGVRTPSPDVDQVIKERADLFSVPRSQKVPARVGGMNSYVGAMFAEDLVLFENVRYGNALYILFEDWAQTSRRSRIDLLKARDGKFVRIPHAAGWQDALQELILAEKKKRSIQDVPGKKSGAA